MYEMKDNVYELLYLYHADDAEAERILYEEFRGYIKTIVKRAVRTYPGSEILEEDLCQEAQIAFATVLNDYRDDMNTSFLTFMILAVKRKVWNVLRHYRCASQIPFYCLVELDGAFSADDSLYEHISQRDPMNEPKFAFDYHLLQEQLENTYESFKKKDQEVFDSWSMGEAYADAANRLSCTAKSYGGRLQKVRDRVHTVLKDNTFRA